MHNYWDLYKTEIKKILSRRSIWIMLTVGMLLLFVSEISGVLPFGPGNTYRFPDGTTMSGYEYYQRQKKTGEAISGQKLDDDLLLKIREDIAVFLKDKQDLPYAGINDSKKYRGVWFAAEKLGYEDLLAKLYTQFQDADDPIRVLMECTASEYAQAMRNNLGTVFSRNGLRDREAEYWFEKNDSRELPMTYEYARGYAAFLDMFYIYIWFVFLLIMVSLSGIFSEEVSHRTDAMILSTRNGRTPISLAKICSGMTVGLSEMVFVLGVNLAVCLTTFGCKGWNAPLLMAIQSTAWNLSVGEAVLILFGLALVLSVLFAAVTMLLSQILGSSVSVMAVQTGIFFLGIFNIPDSFGVISLLWAIRPTNFLSYSAFSEYRLFAVGGQLLNVFQAAGILYPILIAAAVPMTYASYQRTQVKSR